MMNSTGYKEKAPANIQEDDIKKLNSYMEELKIVSEAEKDLERMIDGHKWSNWLKLVTPVFPW